MRSRLLAAVAASLALGTTGCAGPKPQIDYAGKAVPINVAFGKPPAPKGASPVPGTVLAPAPGGVGVVPLVPGISLGPSVSDTAAPTAPPAPVVACPAQDPFKFPRREATNLVTTSVPEGAFPFRINGSFTVNGKKTPYTQIFVETVKRLEPDPAGRSRFTVQYTLLGVPYTLTYSVTAPSDPALPGEVGLASIVRDSTDGSGASFTPAKPLRLLQLRAEAGVSWTDATADALSGSSATVNGSIIGKAKVNACGQPVEAWKTQVSQRIVTPGQDVTATRTLYFSTGYGGLLVGEEVSYSGTAGGDTISGASTSTINVDPGAP